MPLHRRPQCQHQHPLPHPCGSPRSRSPTTPWRSPGPVTRLNAACASARTLETPILDVTATSLHAEVPSAHRRISRHQSLRYRVEAIGENAGANAASGIIATPPGLPRKSTISDLESRSVRVSWPAVANATAYDIALGPKKKFRTRVEKSDVVIGAWNICSEACSGYGGRVGGMAQQVQSSNIDILTLQEAGDKRVGPATNAAWGRQGAVHLLSDGAFRTVGWWPLRRWHRTLDHVGTIPRSVHQEDVHRRQRSPHQRQGWQAGRDSGRTERLPTSPSS